MGSISDTVSDIHDPAAVAPGLRLLLINKAGPWCFSEFLHLYICFYIYIRRDIMGLYCKCLDLAPGLRHGDKG